MYKGPIIDSHMHLWDYQSKKYPWLDSKLPGGEKMLGDHSSLRRDFLPHDYQLVSEKWPINKTVHVQVFGYPENPVRETEWLQKQFEISKIPTAAVAFVDLSLTNAEEILEKHSIFSVLRGVRNVLCYHNFDSELRMVNDEHLMLNKQWQQGFSKLAKLDLSFDVQIFDHQIPDLILLAKQFSETTIILEHFAWPTDFTPAGFELWQAYINKIAECNNVFMKLSAIGCVFKKLDKQLITPYLFHILDRFGVDRCLIGTNFPVDGLFTEYDNLMIFFHQLLKSISVSEQEKLFYRNAERVYKI